MKDKQVKATNMLQVYDRLKKSPVTLDALHDWMKESGIDVSKRTLYRYLDGLLNTINFHGEKLVAYHNESNKKVWKIETTGTESLLKQADLNNYTLLKSFLPRSLEHLCKASLQKIDAVIFETAGIDAGVNYLKAQDFIAQHSFEAIFPERDEKILQELITAIRLSRKIKLQEFVWDARFLPVGFKAGIEVLPLKLIVHLGLIYVCVYVADLKKICVLPVTDIIETDTTKEEFKGMDYQPMIEAYFSGTFGVLPNLDDNIYDIEIEFAANAAGSVSKINWHHSQSFSRLENGNMLMRMRCGLNSELVAFVMHFHHNAKVLLPYRLRAMVMGRLQDTLKIYTAIDALKQEPLSSEKKLPAAFYNPASNKQLKNL